MFAALLNMRHSLAVAVNMLHHACRNAGLLVWSIALVEWQRDVAAAAVFAALLNMKHLFAAAAPVYFVYLLRHGCR